MKKPDLVVVLPAALGASAALSRGHDQGPALVPNLLHERNGQPLQPVAAAHHDVGDHRFVEDGLNLVGANIASEDLRVAGQRLPGEQALGVASGAGNTLEDRHGQGPELLDFHDLHVCHGGAQRARDNGQEGIGVAAGRQ